MWVLFFCVSKHKLKEGKILDKLECYNAENEISEEGDLSYICGGCGYQIT